MTADDKHPETIFDKILRKELPADIVFEDEVCLAFRDIAPQAPVHVLVIPKQRLVSFADLSKASTEAVGSYMQRISQVAKQLGLAENGYRVVFNTGQEGGQTVPYIHAHILGGRSLQWPPG